MSLPCATPSGSAPRSRASEWRISPTIYTDYEDVLADPNVDAVELLTPTHLHADQIIAGLEAGKHVSCQKPIAVSIPEADRVGVAAARANTLFRISENFLFYPPIVKAKELLDSGAIGEPNLVRIRTVIGSYELTVNDYVLADGAMEWRRDAGTATPAASCTTMESTSTRRPCGGSATSRASTASSPRRMTSPSRLRALRCGVSRTRTASASSTTAWRTRCLSAASTTRWTSSSRSWAARA